MAYKNAAVVRAARKLHFTVTPIADIGKWRAEQVAKEEQWLVAKAKRQAQIAVDMETGALAFKHKDTPSISAVEALVRGLSQSKARVNTVVCAPRYAAPKSWFSRMKSRIFSLFMSIKFEL